MLRIGLQRLGKRLEARFCSCPARCVPAEVVSGVSAASHCCITTYGFTCGRHNWGEGLETLKVSGKSRPNAVAGAIAALLRSQGEVEVQAIGPAAVNQAVKAIAIARGYIIPENLDLHTQPAFVKLDIENEERTAVRFAVRGFKIS
jgi:stage V sporulation protein S